MPVVTTLGNQFIASTNRLARNKQFAPNSFLALPDFFSGLWALSSSYAAP